MYKNAKFFKIVASSSGPAGIKVDINGVLSFVPLDPANTDYQNIMRLVEANELQIADPE